jgi:predicted transcriptional regulator
MSTHKNGANEMLRGPKDKTRLSQLQTIFQYLKKNVATASMVTDATDIPQKCITRYKRDLEKSGQLWEVFKTYCKKTGFKAWYLTTDASKASSSSRQLKLFADETE